MQLAIVLRTLLSMTSLAPRAFPLKFGRGVPFKFQGKTLGFGCNCRTKQEETSNEAKKNSILLAQLVRDLCNVNC